MQKAKQGKTRRERARRVNLTKAQVSSLSVRELLATELETFEARKDELLQAGQGKFVLIKGNRVSGIFEDEMDAVRHGRQAFGLAPFLVREITPAETVPHFPSFQAEP